MADGFGDEIAGSVLHRRHDVRRRWGSRQHDHRHLGADPADVAQGLQAILTRHYDVEQQQRNVGLAGVGEIADDLIAVLGEFDVVALSGEGQTQIVAYFRLVFRD